MLEHQPVSSGSNRRPHTHLGTRFSCAALIAIAVAVLVPLAPGAQGGDTTPPTVTSRSPQPGATSVSPWANVAATFSEPIQPSTLSMVLTNPFNQTVAGQVTYDSATQTATLNPNAQVGGSRTFTVKVSGARDLAGNQMAPTSWSYTATTGGFRDVVLPQIGLVDPTVMAFASDERVFVAEKSGRILVFDNLDDETPTLVADLRLNVHNFWDRGMLGMALHPNFPATPFVYVLYSYDAVPGGAAPRWGSATAPALSDGCPTPPGPTGNGCVIMGRLSRLEIGEPASWPLDHTDEVPLVTDWPQQFPSHSIGALVFGPDGALYVTGGDGAAFTFTDYGQTASSPTIPDPANQGGALRSQDIRTSGDPVTLDGSVIRIDPDTGLALPDNPRFIGNPDPNGQRIVAHGLRNPLRFTIRPGTRELWVGDVGWSTWEEINRIVDPLDATVENFGWPCYEGNGKQGSYDSLNLPICENLYLEGASAVAKPYYTYKHSDLVVTGEACPVGSSSISGLAFYTGDSYPAVYNGALFFADYSRNCIWAMRTGANGLPDPANRVTIRSNGGGPVNLVAGPGGDIFYPGYDDDRLHHLRYFNGNQPPVAAIQANPTGGIAPLTVLFSAGSSTDPEGLPLTYAWDFDEDGAFDDSTALTPQRTFTGSRIVTVRLQVTDSAGLTDVAAIDIAVSRSTPTAIIDAPASALTWKVGDPITFSGRGADPDEPSGFLPPSRLSWDVIMHHCPSNCHVHSIQSFAGVAAGTFMAPDHEYPSFLEIRLTATDATGLQNSASVMIQPKTVAITVQSNPPGLQVAMNATSKATPFTRTVIVGSANSLAPSSPQTLGGATYRFTSWSDGAAENRTITAPATPATYTATYSLKPPPPSGLVAAYAMGEGAGTTTADWTGNGLNGAIVGPTWTSAGRFGAALSFDGVNDWLTVSDANSLDFTTAMTLEAWVFPTASGGGSWRNVLMKQRNGGEVYNLYANTDFNAPAAYVASKAQPTIVRDARGSAPLPVNTWTHLAVTYNNATLRLYVNGVQVGTGTMAGPLVTSAGLLRVGGNAIRGEFFQGTIDEVRLYNRVLTPSQIQADMTVPITAYFIPPKRLNLQPSGTLPAGTTQTTLRLTTNESATCRYGQTAGVPYDSLVSTFTTTGGTVHATTVNGLTGGASFTYYVRCQDADGHANAADVAISFSVASASSLQR